MEPITLRVKKDLFAQEALLKAACMLIDDYYLLLDKDSEDYILTCTPKEEDMEINEEILEGILFNHLIAQEVQQKVSRDNYKIKETIVGKVLIHAIGVQPLVSELIFDEDEEDEDEDLDELSTPWEDKS